MDQWTQHSRWAYRAMYPQLVAALFDITVERLMQDVTAGSPLYPSPNEVRLGKPTWSEQTVFTAIREHFPALRPRIPRLFPDPRAGAPAQFVGTQIVELDDNHNQNDHYGVHVWSPRDGRGLVAIAYRTVGVDVDADAAQRLLHHLQPVSAVVIPDQRAMTIPGGQFGHHQPSVHVAERGSSPLSGWAWLDVLGLLRTDIPWWPAGLDADLATILSWRPGDAASPAPVVIGRPS
ncbi:hypothetical protein [Mycolicibacterium sphagni]|uniref:Uncharacterized protein n=1 Tax=Mycolicibacterium sphagni TaxID=1786 RepID=A0ABX2K0G5_9MYCO|nr:hypothetical protein [Mycolicibacterium sphagni]NTY62637.1 hypothetical protein [Mycolicibacterium sphagni]